MAFTINQIFEDGFEKVVIKDESNGTSVEILPECGAILHAFKCLHRGEIINIIDHYLNKKDFEENVTSKGFKSCKLSPFACRMNKATYQHDGQEYKVNKFSLGNHALHGLIYDATFNIEKQIAGNDLAMIILKHSYQGADAGYPFEYDCIVTYTLKAGNELTIVTSIYNRSSMTIPIQDGWHPYFTLGGCVNDWLLHFNSRELVEFDNELIPTGEITLYNNYVTPQVIGAAAFDHCFTLNFGLSQPMCTITNPKTKLQLSIIPENSYPFLQIYTPDDRMSIAIENLSAAPDTFNNNMGLIYLPPEQSTNFTTTYVINSLSI